MRARVSAIKLPLKRSMRNPASCSKTKSTNSYIQLTTFLTPLVVRKKILYQWKAINTQYPTPSPNLILILLQAKQQVSAADTPDNRSNLASLCASLRFPTGRASLPLPLLYGYKSRASSAGHKRQMERHHRFSQTNGKVRYQHQPAEAAAVGLSPSR